MVASQRPLTERQRRFVEAYAASGNGTAAARAAGLGAPEVSASRLLRNAKVAAAIRELAEKRKSAAHCDRDERSAFLTKVVRGKARGAKMNDKLKAVELLGKMNGDFSDGPVVQVATTGSVTVYVPANGRE